LGKGTDAIAERRRVQREVIDIETKKKESLPAYFESYGDLVVEFELLLEHDQKESQLVDAVLSYYQVAYKKVTFLIIFIRIE
jgi:hypothetical protein